MADKVSPATSILNVISNGHRSLTPGSLVSPNWPGIIQVPPAPSLADFPDHELIMEMLRRGYAVALLPVEELAEGVAG